MSTTVLAAPANIARSRSPNGVGGSGKSSSSKADDIAGTIAQNPLWRERAVRGINAAMASPPKLFDRSLMARRLDRALARPVAGADFLLRRAAEELADRLALVRREFPRAADVGSPGPHGFEALRRRPGAEATLRLAPTAASAALGEGGASVGDIERLPLGPENFELLTSLYALHGVNDLVGALIQMRLALKPDGLLIAALAGGDTLVELRYALTAAESELTGGASPRVAPFADLRALGGLLQRAGFALPVVDADRVVVRYADMFALMRDLRALGATNALHDRSRKPLSAKVFTRGAEIYCERYSDPDGRVRATFETLWISGWAPSESQPKPLKPGSAAMRLEDALKAAGKTG